jgi:hypothetical protein
MSPLQLEEFLHLFCNGPVAENDNNGISVCRQPDRRTRTTLKGG